MTADQTACSAIIAEETPDAAVISNLGAASYHLITAGDRERNFYMTGHMGGTTPMGLGLALAIDDPVTVIDGDGSLLMSLGTLSTVAAADPANLTIVLMDNGVFETTGGQPTLSSHVDFAAVAEDCGLAAFHADSETEFRAAYGEAAAHEGPAVVVCEVSPDTPEDHPPLDYSHAYQKHRFRSAVRE